MHILTVFLVGIVERNILQQKILRNITTELDVYKRFECIEQSGNVTDGMTAELWDDRMVAKSLDLHPPVKPFMPKSRLIAEIKLNRSQNSRKTKCLRSHFVNVNDGFVIRQKHCR